MLGRQVGEVWGEKKKKKKMTKHGDKRKLQMTDIVNTDRSP